MSIDETDEGATATLVRQLRAAGGLTQRELAAVAGTSGPTIAFYETGAKEPRLSTLRRLAASVGLRIDVRLEPAERGGERRRRREWRSLAIAGATTVAVARDFPAARRLAEENLDRMSEVVGDNAAHRWIVEWRRVLDEGPTAVRRALLEPGDHGHDMRQMAPFAGLLTEEERTAVLAAVDVLDSMGGTR